MKKKNVNSSGIQCQKHLYFLLTWHDKAVDNGLKGIVLSLLRLSKTKAVWNFIPVYHGNTSSMIYQNINCTYITRNRYKNSYRETAILPKNVMKIVELYLKTGESNETTIKLHKLKPRDTVRLSSQTSCSNGAKSIMHSRIQIIRVV